ncbi:hypothetical protein WJX82_006289 [Trebouxia sp. C0006]
MECGQAPDAEPTTTYAFCVESRSGLQQLNYTSSPSQGFVGSFAGPLYSAGTAAPSCSVLISPGLGTETFIVAPNLNYGDAACTDLSALAFADYSYIGTEAVKCTAPGEGYMFNYPANVAGAPPTVGGQYFCVKFKLYGNTTEMTFTEGYTSDIQCPDDFTNSSMIASDPGNNAGYVIYYALQGSLFPPC